MIFSARLRDQYVLEGEFGLLIQLLRTVFEGEEQEFNRNSTGKRGDHLTSPQKWGRV
jgi:hypothetical protein